MSDWQPGPGAKWSRDGEPVPPPDRPIRVQHNGHVFWLDRNPRPVPVWRRFAGWLLSRLRK